MEAGAAALERQEAGDATEVVISLWKNFDAF